MNTDSQELIFVVTYYNKDNGIIDRPTVPVNIDDISSGINNQTLPDGTIVKRTIVEKIKIKVLERLGLQEYIPT
jgi:hypothetical protein